MWHNTSLSGSRSTPAGDDGVSIHSGFPNAGTDSTLSSLDLGRLLIQNPSSTFFMRIRGSSGEARGIHDGDVIVIDRALAPRRTDTVIFWHQDGFLLDLLSRVPPQVEVWGVVTATVQFHRQPRVPGGRRPA